MDFELSPGTRLEFTDNTLNDAQYPLQRMGLVEKTYSVAGTGGRLDASAVSGGENIGELNVVLPPGAGSLDEQDAMFCSARSAGKYSRRSIYNLPPTIIFLFYTIGKF